MNRVYLYSVWLEWSVRVSSSGVVFVYIARLYYYDVLRGCSIRACCSIVLFGCRTRVYCLMLMFGCVFRVHCSNVKFSVTVYV